jgi:putative hemolysin
MLIEILVVVLLTIVNGLLAMSELAIVSSRPARLKILADQGSRGARIAIRLAEHPGRFLSSVQIGITLVGVLSGAFSGATLGARLGATLASAGMDADLAEPLGVGAVVVAITYLSLIVGELVPKQIALRAPEEVAARVAPAMLIISRVAAPLIWLLDHSGKALLALLGMSSRSDQKVTDEEVRFIIAEAEASGSMESGERQMIAGVMRIADRTARGLMTPRIDVEVLNVEDDRDELLSRISRTKRSRFPVREGDEDNILGVVDTRDVFASLARGEPLDLRSFVQDVPFVMDSFGALDVLEKLRSSGIQMVIVYDEYGHFEGIVTPMDLLDAITGGFADSSGDEPKMVARDDGSFLVAGWMPADEFADRLGLSLGPGRSFETVAGLVLEISETLPDVGDKVRFGGWTLEVVDLDGRRIDKVLVSRDGQSGPTGQP